MTTHTDDIRFNRGPARRPVATTDAAVLQWSTGLTTTRREIYAGWLIETGKSDTLDDALHAAGYETVQIKHGSGNVATHWRVEVADLIVLADGVQSINEMKHTADRYGVAFWWRKLPDGRAQSQLQVQCLLRPLVEAGHWEPVVLSVKSTLTGDVIDALLRQFAVLDAFDAYRVSQGREAANAPFYAFSLALGAGEEVQRGTTQTKAIVPPVAFVPETPDADYFRKHAIRREWVERVEALTAQAVAWSVQRSAQGDATETPDTLSEGATYDPPATDKQRGYIAKLTDDLNWSAEQLSAYANEQGYDLVMLTQGQASVFIDGLKAIAAPVPAPAKAAPPKDAAEAEERFWSRYGPVVGGRKLPDVYRFIGRTVPTPRTADDWLNLARIVRDTAATSQVAA